eukprot:469002-Rhodomonas_salina.1
MSPTSRKRVQRSPLATSRSTRLRNPFTTRLFHLPLLKHPSFRLAIACALATPPSARPSSCPRCRSWQAARRPAGWEEEQAEQAASSAPRLARPPCLDRS